MMCAVCSDTGFMTERRFSSRYPMTIMRLPCEYCDSDAAATAAPCGDMAVPKNQQARAESIAKNTPIPHRERSGGNTRSSDQ